MRLNSLILTLALMLGAQAARAEDMVVDGGLLGPARVLPAAADVRAVALLISDRQGWDATAQAAADRLTAQGVAVIAIDLPSALALGAKEQDACISPQWSAQDLSHEVQRRLSLSTYHLPWIAGIGAGGGFALALAQQGRAATFAGVIAVDSVPPMATDKPLCPAGAIADVPGFALSSQRRTFNDAVQARAGMATVQPAKVSLPPAVALASRLTGLVDAGKGVEDLPLVVLPAKPAHGVMAIVYSGDGGWRDLDKDVAEYLQGEGVPTVGLDMLRYFWAKRSPDDSAADLAMIIETYRRRFGVEKVVLVGYSFGADIMPTLYNLLPEEDRAAVVQLSLLGLSDEASWEVSVGEFLGDTSDAVPTLPELEKIKPGLIQCIDGSEDDAAICKELHDKEGVEVVTIDGGHHFDGDYDHLAQIVLDGVSRRESAKP